MELCRALKFEDEPNYKEMARLFETCLERHNFDQKILDFTWKQNRLSKDKEALKAQMLGVIHRKPKKVTNDDQNTGQAGEKHSLHANGTGAAKNIPGSENINAKAPLNH